jgi:hypothetical protein
MSILANIQGWATQRSREDAPSAELDLVHHYGLALGLDQIAPNELRLLNEHWASLKRRQLIPSWSDVDMSQLGFCGGNLAVAAVEAEPFRVRYDFVGEELVQLCGDDLTGRYVDELYSASLRSEALAGYRRVVATAEPIFTRQLFDSVSKRFGYYRLMLPFAESERSVDHVLVGIYPTDGRARRLGERRSVGEILGFWRPGASAAR